MLFIAVSGVFLLPGYTLSHPLIGFYGRCKRLVHAILLHFDRTVALQLYSIASGIRLLAIVSPIKNPAEAGKSGYLFVHPIDGSRKFRKNSSTNSPSEMYEMMLAVCARLRSYAISSIARLRSCSISSIAR